MGSVTKRHCSGRKPKVTDHTKRQIERKARNHHREPLEEVGKAVEPQVSASTVRSVLAEKGYHRRVAREVTNLTRDHKKARMALARERKKMTEYVYVHGDKV